MDTNHREVFRNLNVLVVDDISAVRHILAQILRGLGVEGRIDTASDGLEAWEMMQNSNYSVVICDIRMPRMNGLELRRLLRATPRFAELPFLMITGEVSEDIMALAVESKWDGYLLKPFPSAVLEKRLLKLLAKADDV
ncbi:MAG: response regulator [Deltaproteobacteria bacterium]|nr:response regulator [Deltaproteobacteria bacterium]